MYTSEELQAAAARLKKREDCQLGKILYEGEGKKIVVLPYFHGNKTGLAYLVQEADAADTAPRSFGARILPLDSLDTGHSEALEDYKKTDIPIFARSLREKRESREREAREAQEAAQKAAAEAERIRFHGFTDGMSHMQKGRVVKTLDKMYRYRAEEGLDIQGGIMKRAARVEQLYKAGCTVRTRKDAQGKTEYWVDVAPHRGYIVTKTEYEYFKYLESKSI